MVAERVHLGIGQLALHEPRDRDRAAVAQRDRGVLRDRVDEVEHDVAALAHDVAEGAAADLALAVGQLEHDVAPVVEPGGGHRTVEVVLAEDLVAGGDRDRAGRLGVHPEGAGGQAGRVDRAEPGGVEGDRGDLLATVEHLRVERESHAVGRVAAGVGGGAGQQRTGGGRAGGQKRATRDRRSHANSSLSAAVRSCVRNGVQDVSQMRRPGAARQGRGVRFGTPG